VIFGPSLAALWLGALCSNAFCRSNVNNDPNGQCLWWDDTNITLTQSSVGNPATGPSAFTSVDKAWASWQAAAHPCSSINLSEAPQSSSRTQGFNPNGPNENLLHFRQTFCMDFVPQTDPCWASSDCNNAHDCWSYQAGTIALTTTTYDKNTGVLFDADIELNAAKFIFTTVDAPPCLPSAQSQSCVATDIQNTVTHETGHALGLDHNTSPTSTMFNSAPVGETSKRTLDPGSAEFLCKVYPDGGVPQDCLIFPVQNPELLGPTAGCGATGGEPLGALWFLGVGTAVCVRRAGRRKR
jgi:hypothetical protein